MRKLIIIILAVLFIPTVALAEGYEVLNPACAEYLGERIPDDVFQQWLQDGWIIPSDEKQPESDPARVPQPGSDCHLMTWPCGPGCHYVDCVSGAGAVHCWCEDGVLPPPPSQ